MTAQMDTLAQRVTKAQDRCDQAAGWLLWLDDEQRRLVLLRAAKVRWRFVEPEFGITRKHLHHRWFRALKRIADRLAAA